ncbi:phosphate transport system permease protein [Ectothiorhodospira mobilis]|uniref:Phosphate transport system permease protein n=1 Tax=Ectothiorhodospira mobilis TaxID=195064 RepID=A0A1I4PDV7_ECTMO|nr:ABC transporter permease subunit [Ectothiorhodospira mobilis]SFM25931.1 phosphate transport system permease protein [Ectothiorhodospira mobilis]
MNESVAASPERGVPGAQQGLLPSGRHRARLRRWRAFKDSAARYGIGTAGVGVVIALGLIFVYLFSEVLPLLTPADVKPLQRYELPVESGAQPVYLSMERYEELGVVFSDQGEVSFFETGSGKVRERIPLPIPEGVEVTAFSHAETGQNLAVYGLSDGRILVGRHTYGLTYPDDRRYIDPGIEYPLGKAPLELDPQGRSLKAVAIQEGNNGFAVAAITADQRLVFSLITTSTNLFTGETTTERDTYTLSAPPDRMRDVLVTEDHRAVYVIGDSGSLHYYDVTHPQQSLLRESRQVVPEGEEITATAFLVGTRSLITGGSDGSLDQWFLARGEDNVRRLVHARSFEDHEAAITTIAPEKSRKGFYAGDASGSLGIHYATSDRTLFLEPVADAPIKAIGVSPVYEALLVATEDGAVRFMGLRNPHPEYSLKALWGQVLYEGYEEPVYKWQSSSASNEFEPKFSLVPLTLGTLKAAFFAMLFAMPLGLMGAIYTAYFMHSSVRGFVKPTVEIMEAMPTVILGFLAGLWLAPFVENHLPAVFSILLLMPLAMILTGLGWSRLPDAIRRRVPAGLEMLVLVPVVILLGWVCVALSPVVELLFFGGNMRQWFTDIGINYDQRNALVVGMAMGFAVIPTIFSIAEDAVFNVPRHLTQGSLALGATAWQTVVGVVLPTASPGMFAAVMMGFGRAVGETMIVLMATGNTPVMDFSLFSGMRTLSANVAVEMPETAVGSTHYRILFLSALVLLVITFIVNTASEIIRQRLRQRYSNL